MKDIPISVLLENAREETKEAVDAIRKKYSLRPCIMDEIVSSILADIRNDTKAELTEAMKEILEELEKAKAAAKKVLKAEPEQAPESDMGQQDGNPEE